MAIESYEQIMARLNGQQTQTPKAATDFSTYVQNLLLNTNPQGGMMSDAEAYRADPFRRQNAINASLDEALKKKQAEEAAKAAAARGGMGMMGSGGDSAGGIGGRNYYQEIEDRFYQENLTMGLTPETAKTLAAQQAFEIQSANNAKLAAGLTLFGNAMVPGMSQMNLANYGPTAYADYLQGNARVMMGDTSGYVNPNYQPKAAGIAAPVASGTGGTTRSADAIQEAINRAQSMSTTNNGMEAARIAAEQSYGVTPTFSNSSDGYSAQGDGSGGYSAPTMSDPYGGYI